jgi:hypothetical protein
LDYVEDMLANLDGAPSFLAMNSKMRSAFNKVARRTVAYTEERDDLGRPVSYYDGIRLLTIGDKQNSSTPIIPNSTTTGEGQEAVTVGTSLYAIRKGQNRLERKLTAFSAIFGAKARGKPDGV